MRKKIFDIAACIFLAIFVTACRNSAGIVASIGGILQENPDDNQIEMPEIIFISEDETVTPGSEVALSAQASTSGFGSLSYQWFRLESGESIAIDNAAQTNITFAIRQEGIYTFYCRVTNTVGTQTCSKDSDKITITVSANGTQDNPIFTMQPSAFNLMTNGGAVTVECEVQTEYPVKYQWYESSDGVFGLPVKDAEQQQLAVPPYLETRIAYYWCVATAQTDGFPKAVSETAAVAYTGLPLVRVDTENNAAIADKENWVSATISVSGAADESWNFDGAATGIRGRGNTTWGQPKKPYALKLDKKQEIMGMPKHKRWVLIANYLDNSFMRNQMAFYLSERLGLDYTVRGEFCDLILNGDYKGLYWLGEAIKCDENRVDIDEDDDWLIEMDVYYDEAWKFKSAVKNLPYMVKNDDRMAANGEAQLATLKEKVDALEKLLYPADGTPDETYADTLDIDSWAKFWLVNEIMDNGELGHPKSCYFTFETAQNRLKAGPVWDFDWASLAKRTNVRLQNTLYYDALFKSPAFTAKVKAILNDRAADIDISGEIEALRPRLRTAAALDAEKWGVNHNPNGGLTLKDFDAHVDFLKEALEQKHGVVAQAVAGL